MALAMCVARCVLENRILPRDLCCCFSLGENAERCVRLKSFGITDQGEGFL